MKFFIATIIVVLLALSLFLARSVGVAFCLGWIFPAISFEIGVLIGSICLSMNCYAFVDITNALSNMFSSLIGDENDIFDKIYDEIDLDNVILPRSTRSRRKRR